MICKRIQGPALQRFEPIVDLTAPKLTKYWSRHFPSSDFVTPRWGARDTASGSARRSEPIGGFSALNAPPGYVRADAPNN